MIVSYPAGNASDILGRVIAQSLSDRLGQSFFVENRPGGSGTVGTGLVAKAAPDGYTLLMEVVTANAINATLFPELDYDFARDVAPVARLATGTGCDGGKSRRCLAKTIPNSSLTQRRIRASSIWPQPANGSPTGKIFGEALRTT